MSESGGSRRSGNKMRPLEALRRKLAKTASGRGRGGARRRQPSHHHDPSSRFGVESHTLSVQQTSEGILSTSSSAVETTNEDDETDSESLITAAKRPRSLRVSLTLPPSVDTSPVSSTTQRSPPQAQLPWRQMDREERSVDASESSPEPTLQIKEEDSENEENGGGKGGESSPASVSVVTVSTDSDQQQTNDSQHDKSIQNIISNTGPPPLSSALPPPPLMELDSTSNTQDKEASSCVGETKKQSEEVLVISSSTVSPKDISTTTNAGSAGNAAPVEATQQSMETDQDVIIIEDNSTSSRKRKTSPLPSSSNDTLITTSSKLATTVTKTSVSTPDRSLVKVVPGVTSLMPSKHSRKSVIHNTSQHTTPSPVSTPSPLEQLQIQVHKQALMSRGSIYSGTSTTSNRRNSYQGSSNNNSTQFRRTNSAAQPSSSSSSSISSTHVSAVTTTVTPPGSTPLSHISEESVYTEKDARSLNTHRQLSHTDRVSMLSSSSNVSSLQHRKDSPATIKPTLATVSNIGRSVKAFDQRAFTKEIITSTRSRKPLAPPMHVSLITAGNNSVFL